MAKVYKVDETFDHTLFIGASCAFGVFDGVHRGHRFLIDQAKRTAAESGGKSIALTFDIDPDERFHADRLKKLMTNEQRVKALADTGVDCVVVLPERFHADRLKKLMTNEQRVKALADTGVDCVVVLPFTPAFSAQSPMAFMDATFGGCAPYAMHVGTDFRFGAKAAGTVSELHEWGDSRGTRICSHDLESFDGRPITATRIRHLLGDCKVAAAIELLGHPYTFEGVVQQGRGQGNDMGFATANLQLPAMMQVLGEAVYAAYVTVDGVRYKSAMSVGVAPTFADATATCEAHILDFDGKIYGDTIKVEPVEFLRPMIKFDSVDELIATVKGNIEWVRENL